jgi:DNA-binding transcriptional regulator YiaG
MSEAYPRIRAGLEQAIAHAAGESVEVVLHYPAMQAEPGAEPNAITATWQRCGLSETEFAQALRISPHTLRLWEKGQRKPSGTAETLLKIVARHPEVLHEIL